MVLPTERTVCHGGQVFDVPSKERKEVCPLVQAAQAALGVADLEYLIEHTSSSGMAALTRAHYRKLLAAAKEREAQLGVTPAKF